jgi:hypothetical protein
MVGMHDGSVVRNEVNPSDLRALILLVQGWKDRDRPLKFDKLLIR